MPTFLLSLPLCADHFPLCPGCEKVFVDKALVDKERYKTEMAEYLKNKPPSEPEDEEEKPDDSDEADDSD